MADNIITILLNTDNKDNKKEIVNPVIINRYKRDEYNKVNK